MRKYLISLLLASALTPAVAAADVGERGGRDHAERSEKATSSNDRPQRAERAVRSESPQRAEKAVRAERPQRAERAQSEGAQRAERAARAERPVRANGSNDAVRPERVRQDRTERAERPVRNPRQVQQVQPTEPVQQASTPQSRGGLADGFRSIGRGEIAERHDRDGDGHRWRGDWRRDHRYNWYDYRRRYSSLFRLGRYYDPYGWGYNRWSIGFSLWPSYYGSNYWLNDPWQYRLPPAYGPYRWIRYYDDALLVNIYTGQVVDVVYNFFW